MVIFISDPQQGNCRCHLEKRVQAMAKLHHPLYQTFLLSLQFSSAPGLLEIRSVSDMLCKYMQIRCEFSSTPLRPVLLGCLCSSWAAGLLESRQYGLHARCQQPLAASVHQIRSSDGSVVSVSGTRLPGCGTAQGNVRGRKERF